MTGIAIVAIPAEDEPVWKVSSEKVPHMTLLFLEGPLDNEANTIQYIQHAVETSLSRFGMSVDRRGELGPDDADVLFFDKSYGGKELLGFRGFLLQNDSIKTAYSKAEQYPMWTPHLTLGYPKTPAHEDPSDSWGLKWINFDRIAVWTSDYDGPEFVLKKDDSRMVELDAAWSEDLEGLNWGIRHKDPEIDLEDEYGWFIEGVASYLDANPDELEHHGVKGQKWGVRNDRTRGSRELKMLGPSIVTKKTASGHELTLQHAKTTKLHKALARISKRYVRMYNNGANLDIKDKNGKTIGSAQVHKVNKKELNLVWLGIDKSSRGQGYATAVMKVAQEYGKQAGFEKLTLEVPGNSPDARHIYEKIGFKVTKEADPEDLKNDPVWGGLTEMEYKFDKAKHSESLDDFLEHHGILGMKWGVRRAIGPDGLVRKTVRQGTAQGQADRAQKTANLAKSVAEKHKGRRGNKVEQVVAKKTQKRADKRQKQADKVATRKTKVKDLASKAKNRQSEKKQLDEKLAKLSTREIQELNNRIRATQEHRKLSAQEKLYNRSTKKKVADWLLGINQPRPEKSRTKLKDYVEATKLGKEILDDMLKAKNQKGD